MIQYVFQHNQIFHKHFNTTFSLQILFCCTLHTSVMQHVYCSQVYDLKKKYHELVGCDMDALKLIHCGRILNDESVLLRDVLQPESDFVVAFTKVLIFIM